MNRIKKFYHDHEDEINSALMVVAGIGCAVGGVMALQERNRADGMRINNVEVFRNDDGSDDFVIYLANGNTKVGTAYFKN